MDHSPPLQPDDQSNSTFRIQRVIGSEAVVGVSKLLQEMRLSDATGGLWEAADLQWWSRKRRKSDEVEQCLLINDVGRTVGAVLRTDWVDHIQFDVFRTEGATHLAFELLVESAVSMMAKVDTSILEVSVRSEDAELSSALEMHGFALSDEELSFFAWTCWLDADQVPPTPPLAKGFELLSRNDDSELPHHLTLRNDSDVESRLQQCSLYSSDLDLWVRSPEGEVAGYGLFWADSVTGVGLVEPMRTESEFEHQGIASHVLISGMHRLVDAGCSRIKVSSAGPLYLAAGFIPVSSCAMFIRNPAE